MPQERVAMKRGSGKGAARVRSDLSSTTDEYDSDVERRAKKKKRAKMTLKELLEETNDGDLLDGSREGVGREVAVTSTQISERDDVGLVLNLSPIE